MAEDTNVTVDREFPRWMYGPDGQSKIFNRGDEIPEGWVDHPSKLHAPGKLHDPKEDNTPASPVATEGAVAPASEPVASAGDAGESTAHADGEMTRSEIEESLKTKTMSQLWSMASELELDRAGKKDELIVRIADKLMQVQSAPQVPSEPDSNPDTSSVVL